MGLDIHPAVRNESRGACTVCGRTCPECGSEWESQEGPSFGCGYMGFNLLREELAAEEGILLRAMNGFEGDIPWDQVVSPLVPLLDHSDCDGELTPEQCAAVAPRLREIVKSDALAEDGSVHTKGWKQAKAEQLLALLEACAAHGWTAVFM